MGNFKHCREQAGLRQTEAADMLHITQGAISQWENGDCMPRADLLPDIAKLYGCTVDELLKEANGEAKGA